MISNPRHGSPPRLMAHQPTRCSTTQEPQSESIARTPYDTYKALCEPNVKVQKPRPERPGFQSFIRKGDQVVIPTRVKADSFRGFQTGASQIPWRRTGGSPCGQGLPFVRTMTRPSFGP